MILKGKFHNIYGDPKIGEGTEIGSYVEIGPEVEIGTNCKIQAKVFIPSGVKIGNDVFIGPGAIFTNDKHPPSFGENWELIIVEDGVTIGAGAIILPGITLANGTTVGAGAVVTKSTEPGSTVVGVPAKKI